MSLYCRTYEETTKIKLSAELLLDKTSLTIKDHVLQLTLANKQVAITQLSFQRRQKPWHPKTFILKAMYLFYSIYKALIYATVIIAIFRWLH